MPGTKGGRGIKAPYETKLVRVPVPLVKQVSFLVNCYRDFVAEGGEPFNPPLLEVIDDGGNRLIIPARQVKRKSPQKTSRGRPRHWIEKYSINRGHKKHFYYRYVWYDGSSNHHKHIPGGNETAEATQKNLALVKEAMAQGMVRDDILQLIKSMVPAIAPKKPNLK